jgi:hypothetical protein
MIGKGLADEMGERGYVILDGLDGRAHHVQLPASVNLADLPIGSIVEIGNTAGRTRADHNIVVQSQNGIYRPEAHVSALRFAGMSDSEASEVVAMHVRRLDAQWRIPPDFAALARRFDRDRSEGLSVHVRSTLPMQQQVRAVAATWLDRQLLQTDQVVSGQGFGAEIRSALRERSEFLIEKGFASRQGQRVVLMGNLLSTLRDQEIAAAGRELGQRAALTYRPAGEGSRISGIYCRDVKLVSGRYAMVQQEQSFTLVPWRQVLEKRLGQSLSGLVRRGDVSWDFGRARGPSID